MQATSTESILPSPTEDLPPALLIMGPTASGKTKLAIEAAQTLDGEVISVDSALVFRGMDIGTAKPDLKEREGVPHHLIDILDPSERYSTGQFQKDALSLMIDIAQRGRLPILAGGTMLYFHGLIHGISSLPPADPSVRETLEKEASLTSWTALHDRLRGIDPVAAERIHPNDPQRIQRALEIYHITGRPMTDVIAENPPPPPSFRYIPVLISPSDRQTLASRIQLRFETMLQMGFIDEVSALRRRGDLHPDLPAMRAVGYRQVWEHLDGLNSFEEMREKGITATRQFAKRQLTWLRKETYQLTIESEALSSPAETIRQIAKLLD